MDGTLLDSKKRLPKDFYGWVLSHPEIKTVIASGRQYFALERDFVPIKDKLIFMAENGGLCFENDKVIYKNVMEKEAVRSAQRLIDQIPDACGILCGVTKAYARDTVNDTFKNMVSMFYEKLTYVTDVEKIIEEEEIVKLAIFIEGKAAVNYPKFDNVYPGVKSVLSGVDWIDIQNDNTDKGTALEAMFKMWGIKKEEAMAFGDYPNDKELLMAVEESYCMANGHEDMKKLAKHLADTNDNDGVMKVLRTFDD